MLKLEKHIKEKREDSFFPFFHALLALIYIFLSCAPTLAATYPINSNLVGEASTHIVGEEDTLYSIARKFDIGIVDLMAANPGVDAWVPGVGRNLIIPSAYILPDVKRQGIVINLSELRMYYFPSPKTVMTFPVGIGREGWQTPTGETTIILKRKNPSWVPPASILAEKPDLPKIVPAGPDNPLGQYALSLGWESYAIHGTNKPYGIGLRSSHGCIRMYPEDIEVLFKNVSKGGKVTVIDRPYKTTFVDGKLYLEASPTEAQTNSLINNEDPDAHTPAEIYHQLEKLVAEKKVVIDWKIVDEVLVKRTGIPTDITASIEARKLETQENSEKAEEEVKEEK